MADRVKVLWASNAIKSLDGLNRYTRSSVLEDFTDAPVRETDDDSNRFTPVSNGRYNVSWRLKDGAAIVNAVMPGTPTGNEQRDEEQDQYRVLWESDAIKLLDARDRFTRGAILDEFTRAPERDAVEFDRVGQCYLTPVSNRRYSVVWRKDDGDRIVRAVVPMISAGSGDETELKARVERAIERESRGVAY